MSKPKEEDSLDIHKKKHHYASRLVETHKLSSAKAYDAAAEKHITGKDGLVDYKLLDDDEVQKKFTKSMVDYHLSEIKRMHGKEAKDDFDKAILMRAYKGTTPDEIKENVNRYGKLLTKDFYLRQVMPRSISLIQQQLYSVVGEHITEKDLPKITKKLGLEGKLSVPLALDEARDLLNNWADNDEHLEDSILRQILGKKLKKRK